MKRKWMYLLLCFCGVGLFSGCGGNDNGDSASEDTQKSCTDDKDNDGDGNTDCDDDDCRKFCVEEDTDPDWRTSWVTAQQLTEPRNEPPEPGLAENTLRQVIQLSIGGDQLRFTLSNEYGDIPLTIAAAGVARTTEKSGIDTESHVSLTFDGETSVTIPKGETATSDPVEMTVAPKTKLTISMLFDDAPPDRVTGHPGSRTTSYLMEGDAVADEEPADFESTVHWYFVSQIDVLTAPNSRAVVVLGDSISDGYGTTTDQNNRWTNHLFDRLLENEETENIAVLNQAIGGNCMTAKCLGPAGIERFQRDVVDGPFGVEWVIIQNGINDLDKNSMTVARMLDRYTEAAEIAHDAGIAVIGATISPCEGHDYYDEKLEDLRQEINDWIRTTSKFDGYVDFDEILADPDQPTQLLSEYSNDRLHPSLKGYEVMAEGVDLELFDIVYEK